MREFPTSIYVGSAKSPQRPRYRRYSWFDVVKAERALQKKMKDNQETIARADAIAKRSRTEKDRAA